LIFFLFKMLLIDIQLDKKIQEAMQRLLQFFGTLYAEDCTCLKTSFLVHCYPV